MNNVKLKEGAVIGYAIVSESDCHLDAFGNIHKDSSPLVWESNLNNNLYVTKERAGNLKSYGRRVICKLVVVEEVD